MSVKRRDSKNRILQNGESQRQDGRYAYKYIDASGNPQFLYAWKLVPTDKTPAGKRDGPSLREKILQLQKDRLDGIDSKGGNMTVLELVDLYLKTRISAKPTTEANYKTVRNILAKEAFGAYAVKQVKKSDAKLFLIKLQKEDGRRYSTIQNIRGVLRPAFQMAEDDGLIRHNPFAFQLVDVVINDTVTREAISRDEQRRFLDFVKNDKHFSQYYDGIYILFYTGLRISEFCGLTVGDLDMENRTFSVDHQLQRKSDGTKYIETPKTNSGSRILPMSEDVFQCFQRILENRNPPKKEPVIDGYSGFLFFDKDQQPMVAMHWEHYFQHILAKYNKIYKAELPKITPHVCRHTYCTNMAKSGMNPKTLQYLMGHSSISITMDTYTHLGLEDAKQELERMEQIMAAQAAMGGSSRKAKGLLRVV